MTRLAEELVGIAEASGLAARFVRGRSAIADVPLAAFAPLLSGEVERYEGVSLLVAARTAIADLGGGRPLALGVDDVHLLDASSATLVNQLVTAGSVIVVATAHDGEWVPEPISELWRNGHIERWPVGELGPAEAIAMANALLDTDLAPDAADDLVRLTGCNPLFVSTLARAMNETGTTTELDAVAAAPKLVDFVAGRLHWLDPPGATPLPSSPSVSRSGSACSNASPTPARSSISSAAAGSRSPRKAAAPTCGSPTRCTARCCAATCRGCSPAPCTASSPLTCRSTGPAGAAT